MAPVVGAGLEDAGSCIRLPASGVDGTLVRPARPVGHRDPHMTRAMPEDRMSRAPRGLALAWAFGLVLCATSAAFAAPPAGTPIDNTAYAAGSDSTSGSPVVGTSNTVTAIVQALEFVSLAPDRRAAGTAGGAVTFAHRLANRGNAGGDFRLEAIDLGGDDFDFSSFSLVRDVNRDGLAGTGDVPVTNGGTLYLAAGDSADVLVTALVPASAPGPSLGRLSLRATSLFQSVTASVTDTVDVTAAATPVTVAFYASPAYAMRIRSTPLGAPLWVQAIAPRFDRNPALPDTVRISLASRLAADFDTFDAIETGPSTGVFRVTGAPVAVPPAFALVGDGVIEQVRGDLITATLPVTGSPDAAASVWVEPGGTVFDSRSGSPVAGARVQLVDLTGAGNGGAAGGLARVFQLDGVTPASADVVTDFEGRYEFPVVGASTYRLVVTPPGPYTFPSLADPASFGAARTIDVAGSYGGPFAVVADGDPVLLDVPVDAEAPVVLFAEKTASKPVVEWGDQFDYRVKVANRSDSSLAAVLVDDVLPPGVAYVRGTARMDGAPLADPAGSPGPVLRHAIGALAPRASAELTYRVRVTPAAPAGDARSEAVARAGDVASNAAQAVVRIQGDAFADEAMVTGTVFYDANGDGRSSPGEPGLAGVRLYLDDGTFAVTDGNGRYSMTGLTPRTHALKVDRTTLPPEARIAASDHRSAGPAGVRFVDLTRGDLVRADFAAVGDTSLMREAIERRLAFEGRGTDERARVLGRGAEVLAAARAVPDPRTLPASRIETGESELPVIVSAAQAAPAPVAPAPAVFDQASLDRMLPDLEPELGFVGLADLDTVAYAQVPVLVKGRHGTRLVLRVNGKVLPDSRVGRRVSVPRQGLEVWEYVGVQLRPGVNVLEVAPPHSLGRVALRLVAPGPFARLELDAPHGVPADGHSLAALVLRAVDVAGVPVGEHTLVTLDAGSARLAATDLDPAAPGVQLAVEGGALRVPLVAPGTPGDVRVTAAAGEIRTAAVVEFVPDLRPLIAVGSLEGVVSLRRFGGGGPAGGARQLSFESPIAQFANESQDGEATAAAHGAMFLKGRVRESLLLTMGWDSDRPRDQRQFRDLQPDRGYPVLGDASARGWDAQSTGQLYVRLEQRDASVLYGDFVTGGASARALGNYSRSLTGTAARWSNGTGTVNAFTSRDRSARVIDELRGEGTSGPYQLSRTPLLENSERVEIVVRDRAQPALVLSATARQRFTDYEIEPLTGRVLMRAPVPSLDADLNPVYVRVTYEVAGGGAPAWVHGVDGRVRVSPRLELGGSYVDDHDPSAPFELRSLSAATLLGRGVRLEGEWAATRHVGGLAGDAGRFELKREDDRVQARLWGAASSSAFDNPGAGLAGGRSEAGARVSARLAPRTRLNAEGLFSADSRGREKREGFLLALDRALDQAWHGELGVRWSRAQREDAATDPASASVRAKLSAQWPKHPEWAGYGELEQDTREWDRRMAALGGEYRFRSRGRLYLRHELLSSFSSAWALSGAQRQATTVVGVDADVAKDAHLFSEYRVGDAFGGREAQAAVGLRNGWRLASGMRVGTSFERVNPLRGSDAGASTALTGSVDWTDDPVWKGSSRAEVRTSRSSDQFLQSMAAAVKLDSSWTGLGRHLLTLERRHGLGGDARERLQLAAAYRPGGDWEGVGRWELRYDREAPGDGTRTRRVANIAGFAATGRNRGWEGSLAWAGKLTREQGAGLVTAGGAQWLHGRVTRDLGREWDCGVTASVLAGRRIAQRQYGLGAEAGRLLPGGTWLSLGFNRFGYADDELTGEQWTRTGAYLRLRVKFDETLFLRDGVGR